MILKTKEYSKGVIKTSTVKILSATKRKKHISHKGINFCPTEKPNFFELFVD